MGDQLSLDKKPTKNPEDSIISADSGQGSADIDTAIDSPTTISIPSTHVSPPTVVNGPSTPPTKTIDDLSDMDLLTSDDDEVFEIKIVENNSGGNQPDCEDISSEEEWA